MRRYVLSEDTIVEESQVVTSMHPLFDAVLFIRLYPNNFMTILNGNLVDFIYNLRCKE